MEQIGYKNDKNETTCRNRNFQRFQILCVGYPPASRDRDRSPGSSSGGLKTKQPKLKI